MRHLIALVGMALAFTLRAEALEIKLTDGTIITCEKVSGPAGIVSAAPGFDLWVDARTKFSLHCSLISQESLQMLAELPEVARNVKPFVGAKLIPQPVNRPLLAAVQEGLVELRLTGDGKNDLTLRVLRGPNAPHVPLNISISHPLVLKSQTAGDSLMVLRPATTDGNVSLPTNNPAQKNIRPLPLAYLQAVEWDKSVMKTNSAFQLTEADAVTAYIVSAASNLGTAGSAAVSLHHNPGATWDKVAAVQSTSEARVRGVTNFKPEIWDQGQRVLEFATARATALKQSIGTGSSAIGGKWVPVSLDEFVAAVTDLHSEVDSFVNISNTAGETPESLASRAQRTKDSIARMRAMGERILQNKYFALLSRESLEAYADHHYWFPRKGYQVPAVIENDPYGDTRVATAGRWSWDGFRFRNTSGKTEGRVGAGSVSAQGIIMMELEGGLFYGWKKVGPGTPSPVPTSVTVTPGAGITAVAKSAAPATPKAPTPASPVAPSGQAKTAAPSAAAAPAMRRELSLAQAVQEGLITIRLGAGNMLDLTRTEKAGFGPLNLARQKAQALTFDNAAEPVVFLSPGSPVTIAPSGTTRQGNIVKIKNVPPTGKVTRSEDAVRFIQYVLASENFPEPARYEVVFKFKTGGTSKPLELLRKNFDVIEKLTGGNADAWLAGNWTTAPAANVTKNFIQLQEAKVDEEILSMEGLTPQDITDRKSFVMEAIRAQAALRFSRLPAVSAVISENGTMVINGGGANAAPTRWWWDGRFVRLERYAGMGAGFELSPDGLLCNEGRMQFLQKAAGR